MAFSPLGVYKPLVVLFLICGIVTAIDYVECKWFIDY